jgi:GTP cyclohydrolase II
MFSDLVTRPDLHVLLPPIGGTTVYIIGDVANISDPQKQLAVRVHDECNGSDVFSSDICTAALIWYTGLKFASKRHNPVVLE